MMQPTFEMLPPLAGGVLIGVAASLLLLLLGRVAGVSGILGGLLRAHGGDTGWRAAFVGGLVSGGAVLAVLAPRAFEMTLDRSALSLGVAGLLVGFGTRLGNGCTSGHGVCGIARGSRRSAAATITFMLTGMLVAGIIRQLLGGRI